MKTAEWLCTSCSATNRKLVSDSDTRAEDRCIQCHKRHLVEEDERPVRWRSSIKP